MVNLRCFLSYSWESKQHRDWVLALARALQERGIHTFLDQWDVQPGTDLPKYMEECIREASFVLLICTPTFASKADRGQGGVGYEKTIVTGEIFSARSKDTKFIPILRVGPEYDALPSYLRSKAFLDFRNDSDFLARLEGLLRHLYNEPEDVRPALGPKPVFHQKAPTSNEIAAPGFSSGPSVISQGKRRLTGPISPASTMAPVQLGAADKQGRLGAFPSDLVEVPAGSFLMGMRNDEGEDEGLREEGRSSASPQIRVRIRRPFKIGRFPVTVREFGVFVRATNRDMGKSIYTFEGRTWALRPGRTWANPGFHQDNDHPVVGVSWHDAQAYVTWLSKQNARYFRLPTEAEWQYSCRATTKSSRYWGDAWSDGKKFAHASDGYLEGTARVGERIPNIWGLHDMLGNVWEWTQDHFTDDLRSQPPDGNSKVLPDCEARTVLGGSWYGITSFVRAGCRGWYNENVRSTDLGFRIACEL